MSTSKKPTIIGLYGVPGSGKSHLKHQLQQELPQDRYAFFDGADVINQVFDGGLEAFQNLPEVKQEDVREQAIHHIVDHCISNGKIGIVAGHFMFWPEQKATPTTVCTQADLDAYTHIIYLDVDVQRIVQQRREDKSRRHSDAGEDHIRKYQDEEKSLLRKACLNNCIQFIALTGSVDGEDSLFNRTLRLVREFIQDDTEERNLSRVFDDLDKKLADVTGGRVRPEVVLVIDGDKTLGPHDTGKMFFEAVAESGEERLNDIFRSKLGYSDAAFRQVVLACEESTSDEDTFELQCSNIAGKIDLYDEIIELLGTAATCGYVRAVVVTCGLRTVWENVLSQYGLSDMVRIIGGGRISDGYVITPKIKGEIVDRLHNFHHAYVWAIGDSLVDIQMIAKADEALVVVGTEDLRSKSLEKKLRDVLPFWERRLCQVLLPSDVEPLSIPGLTEAKLPTFAELRAPHPWKIMVHAATDKNARKLLATNMRDASVFGRALQEAHRKVGWYLATEYIPNITGLEAFDIPHVQGGVTEGHRFKGEKKTLIVALMRGGEPMAQGVHDALPSATFLHAKVPADVKPEHLANRDTVILVDSVINSGKSIAEFANHIRAMPVPARIIVVSGVVQEEAVLEGGGLEDLLEGHGKLDIVALRLSENKYKGQGGTDTGNRLFNTTDMD